MTNFMSQDKVKTTLRKIGPLKPFKVTFLKTDGSTRTIHGHLDVPRDASKDFPQAVPVFEYAADGFRSFKVDRVINIEYN